MDTKAKIAIVGDADSVVSFASVGITAFGATKETALAVLKKAVKSHQIVFITDNYAAECAEFTKKFNSAPYPIVLTVPSKDGSSGIGLGSLRAAGEKALGVDILFHKED